MFNKYVLVSFLEIAKVHSDASAFCINEKFHTYQQFVQSISKIRSAILKINKNCSNIGLVANDDIETYASIFAIWLEGCAYVPLHPAQPIERSLEIIAQSDIEILLDSSENSELIIDLKIETSKLKFEILNLKPKIVSDEALAFILFTSGSTGKPKGVQISRKNIGTFMKSFWKTGIEITNEDRCLQCFDLTFDVSVQSFLVPLTKGACAFTIPHNQIKYSYIFGLLEDHQLTFSAMPPSMIRYLRPYFDEINIPNMRYNIVTAEASPVDLIDEWSKCIPNAEIYNFYGPTEATIYCTYYKYERDSENLQINGMLSIGKPMEGIDAIILNNQLEKCSIGEKGELCIAGDQLTPGYCNDLIKNKDSFFEYENNGKYTRFYRTGDSCFYDESGNILLAGRLDYQVKIQGYRIELEEIEFHAREFLKGQNVIAVAVENASGNSEIVLIIESETFHMANLKKHLRSKMPFYMMPSQISFVPLFPLNKSNKVDRIQLKTLI